MKSQIQRLDRDPESRRPIEQLINLLKAPIREAEKGQREKNHATALADGQVNYEKNHVCTDGLNF